jgi:hypothetical protein
MPQFKQLDGSKKDAVANFVEEDFFFLNDFRTLGGLIMRAKTSLEVEKLAAIGNLKVAESQTQRDIAAAKARRSA